MRLRKSADYVSKIHEEDGLAQRTLEMETCRRRVRRRAVWGRLPEARAHQPPAMGCGRVALGGAEGAFQQLQVMRTVLVC